MASFEELTGRLENRFGDVPNVNEDDVKEWTETSMNAHGFSKTSDVPDKYVPIILLHAEADGASQIALKTAYYFRFVDKDETVDKTEISKRYRQIANDLWNRYNRLKLEGVGDVGGSRVAFMKRADRL